MVRFIAGLLLALAFHPAVTLLATTSLSSGRTPLSAFVRSSGEHHLRAGRPEQDSSLGRCRKEPQCRDSSISSFWGGQRGGNIPRCSSDAEPDCEATKIGGGGGHDGVDGIIDRRRCLSNMMSAILVTASATSPVFLDSSPAHAATTASVADLLEQIRQAKSQLDVVPDLIKSEKWDSVRNLLIVPPLSDCWTKSKQKVPLLQQFADAVGSTATGDELAVLEAREELTSHLRYLDMAVYNNIFNPIATSGEAGATKQLIRSYYEDPINEYRASVAALDELIQLGEDAR